MKAKITNIGGSENEEPITNTAAALKDGTVLCGLILRFLNNKTNDNMGAVLACLRDSSVYIPCEVKADSSGTVTPRADLPIMPVRQQITIKPQLYKAKDGKVYMPFYTRRENARQSELQGASLVNLPYDKAVAMMRDNSAVGGFLVDPKLYNLVLTRELAEISMNIRRKAPDDTEVNGNG